MTCKDCIHENICVIIAFPEAFENTKWEKEPCDHFKNKADYVEVNHGNWESFEIPHMMRCSECGVSELDIHRTKFDYCPNCGARMCGGK